MDDRKSNSTLIAIGVLTVLIAFMDISGLPSALFVDVHFADIEPVYFALLINFVIICILAFAALRAFAPGWRLGLTSEGFGSGIRRFGAPALIAGIASCFAFIVGIPLDNAPTAWKIVVEGVVYYAGVAFVEELYVRGLFLNLVEDLAYKNPNRVNIAIVVSAVVFGLGHIPGVMDQGALVVAFKAISTIGMGLFFGVAYKKSGNLWVVIALHWIIDVCALPYCFTTFSGYATISLVFLLAIYIALGAYSIVVMTRK